MQTLQTEFETLNTVDPNIFLVESQDVQINREHVEAALEHDPEFFIQFFIGEDIDLPVPKFHKDVFLLMTMIDWLYFVCAIPRDHAKTTLARLACVWYFLFSHVRFIVYISSSHEMAVPSVNAIMDFMQSPNFVEIFGMPEFEVKQDGKGYYKFKLRGKTCILKAFGAGQHVRGLNIDGVRPQLAVCDDFEDNKNIATEQLFLNLKRWFYGPFKKALDKRWHKIIQLGNMISPKSLLYLHCKSRFWHSRLYGCLLSNGKPLWEDVWTIEKLKQDFQQYQEMGTVDIWFAEMMNLPIMGSKGLIQAHEIYYQPEVMPGDANYGFMTIDLAISEQSWAHKTVPCIHMFTGTHWQIVHYEMLTGIDPITLFWHILPLMQEWGIRYCGIESVAFQASLKFVFADLCLQNALEGFEFVDTPARAGKTERLATWAGLIKNREYSLTEGDFVMSQQLLTYDPTKKNNDDDAIDSAAHGVTMKSEFIYDIITEQETRGRDQLPVFQTSYQCSPL